MSHGCCIENGPSMPWVNVQLQCRSQLHGSPELMHGAFSEEKVRLRDWRSSWYCVIPDF